MWKPITAAGIAIFWGIMMMMLWRSEFGHARPVGAAVPASLVWDRILTAPDTSTLEIRHGTNRVGYCRWRADVGQELATGARFTDVEDPLEGMVHQLDSYTLDVDGNIAIAEFPNRARFVFGLKLDTNKAWQEFSIRITMRPDVYEISARAKEQTLRINVDAGGEKMTRTVRLADLQNPQKLLFDLGGPALPLLLGALGATVPQAATTTNLTQSLGIKWEAHNDALLLGRNKVRVYRLRTILLDRYEVVLYVSPIGEILRVELPQKIVLVNDAMSALKPLK